MIRFVFVFLCLIAFVSKAAAQEFTVENRNRRIEIQTAGPVSTSKGRAVVLKKKVGNARTFVPNRWLAKGKTDRKTGTFNVSWNIDPVPADVETAFNHALSIWSLYISSPIPIEVEANWGALADDDVLGYAQPTEWYIEAPDYIWYPIALANRMKSVDLLPDDSDIECSFNSNQTWYFGLDGNTPPDQHDFVTVVLHEIGHGLGFAGSTRIVAGGEGKWGLLGYPYQSDSHLELSDGRQITNTSLFSNPSTELAQAYTGNNLYFHDDGIGYRYRMYAPDPYEPGSSVNHLDEDRFPAGDPSSLMTPQLMSAEAIHDPGPLTLNIFRRFGWHDDETPIYEQQTALGLASCFGQASKCKKITLDSNWTAEILDDDLVITTTSGSTTFDASTPAYYFSNDPTGYVAFYCGSGALSSLEFGDFTDNKAYYAENMLRGIPFTREVIRDGQPVSATDRFEIIGQGHQISGPKEEFDSKSPTARLTVNHSDLGTTAGKVIFTTPDGSLRIECKKIRGVRGEVDIFYNGQLILNEYGDPHIRVPMQALPDQTSAMFQQGDREIMFVLPDARTAVWVRTLDVCRKRDRIIEEVVVLDSKGQHLVHHVAGLYGSSPVDYEIANRAGQNLASDSQYVRMLGSLQGDLAFLSTSGKLLAYNWELDDTLDFELHLLNRCSRRVFDDDLINCIENEEPIMSLEDYYIERPGKKDAVIQPWMQFHVDLFKNP